MSRLRVSPKLLYVATGLVAVLGAGAVYLQFSALGDEEAKVAALRTQARDEKEIRAELEEMFGPEWAGVVEELHRARREGRETDEELEGVVRRCLSRLRG